jgi:hypothetical protein
VLFSGSLASLFATPSSSSSSSSTPSTVKVSLTCVASSLVSCYPDLQQTVNLSQTSNLSDVQVLRIGVRHDDEHLHNVSISFYVPIE